MKFMRVTEPKAVFKIIDNHFRPVGGEIVGLEEAGGRCLTERVYAPEDVPAFNRSTVDGYALSARDTFGAGEGAPAFLDYTTEVLMGQRAPAINPGQCCLVHTGGMLPAEADAVVMIEDTELNGNMLQCFRQVAPGENVIHCGEDLEKGSTVFETGHLLRSPELGVLASLGLGSIKVHRRPVVGFFSTGDELVDYNTNKLEPGRIRDSNAPALSYLAEQSGAVSRHGGILNDQFEVFVTRSREMLQEVDFLVFSGGSSVGTRDYTAMTMQKLGSPGLLVEGVSVQPGKPTLLADCGGKPVLGLPGHPVSAQNIFAIFGTAILDRLSGRVEKKFRPVVKAVLARNISSRSGRTDYIRVRLEYSSGAAKAVPLFGRSGMLRTLAEADGLMIVPGPKEGLAAGETVEVELWN